MLKKLSILFLSMIFLIVASPITTANASQNPFPSFRFKTVNLDTPNTINCISTNEDTKAYIENFEVIARIRTGVNLQSSIGTFPVYTDTDLTKVSTCNGNSFTINKDFYGYTLSYLSKESYKIGDTIAFRYVSYNIKGTLVITNSNGQPIESHPLNEIFTNYEWIVK